MFNILILLLLLSIITSNAANRRFATITNPYNISKSPLCIDSQSISLEITKVNHKKVTCHFIADYYISNESDSTIIANALIYGERSNNISIKYGAEEISYPINDNTIEFADSVMFVYKSREGSKSYYEITKDDITRQGFKTDIAQLGTVLRIEGELFSNKARYNGLHGFYRMDYYKHPLTTNTSFGIGYLTESFNTWNCIGPIKVNIEADKDLEINIISRKNDKEDSVEAFTGSGTEKEDSTFDSYQFILSSDSLSKLSIICKKKSNESRFSIGGPSITLGGSRQTLFTTNFAWEFATVLDTGVALYYKLGYETNFRNSHAIDPEIKFVWAFLGAKFGLPYYIHNNQLGIRQGYTYETSLVSVGVEVDYLIQIKDWVPKGILTFTF